MAKAVRKVKEFDVIFQRDESGYVVAIVPELPGCHTQGRTVPEARERIAEAIGLYLEVAEESSPRAQKPRFIGVKRIAVPLPT